MYKRQDIKKPFVIYKNHTVTVIFTILVTAIVGFANFFTIIQPAMAGDFATTIWSIVGPLVFTIIALILHARYEKMCIRDRFYT